MGKNFAKSLLAVLAGNLIYFLAMPALPPPARHGINRIDLGLLVDFWICVVVYGLIELFLHLRRPRAGNQ